MDQRSDFLKARLAKLPPVPSFPEDPTQDEVVTDTSTETDSSTASIRTIVPVDTTEPTSSKPADPLPWTRYFKENIRVPSSFDPSQSFNVYYSPPTAENAPVYVFHHGAG